METGEYPPGDLAGQRTDADLSVALFSIKTLDRISMYT